MPIELKLLPPMRLAYLRCTGPYGTPAIVETWERLATWRERHGLAQAHRTLLGISQDSPATTPAEQCRYDCCVEVDADFQPGNGIGVQDFAGGRYACAQFNGTKEDIHAAWMHLRGTWLPRVSADGVWQVGHTPLLELYPKESAQNAALDTFQCWLCLPIRAA